MVETPEFLWSSGLGDSNLRQDMQEKNLWAGFLMQMHFYLDFILKEIF